MFRTPQIRSVLSTSRITRLTGQRNIPKSPIHTTASLLSGKHSADSYSKEVDCTPPEDTTVYRIDPESDLVQKPYEPPSGEWSRAGVRTDEYRHVEGAKQPYAPQGGDKGGYGARKSGADKGRVAE
ncbi:hypothetical protein BDZ97DRAFT_145570 [Flammula alnicola]|nr:hypothetical protein BDZ97DRAFT_145570 [Flammula alnicola]